MMGMDKLHEVGLAGNRVTFVEFELPISELTLLKKITSPVICFYTVCIFFVNRGVHKTFILVCHCDLLL